MLLILITICNAKPNIVFIMADDLGYNDISYTGSTISETPNIDHIAENGIFLNNYYAGSSVCTPSRGSTLTGKYFRRLGLYPGTLDPFDIGGLNETHKTYISILKDFGYVTAMVGKWHLGMYNNHDPQHHGFDKYYGIPFSHDECTNDIYWTRSASNIYGPCPLFDGHDIVLQGNVSMKYIDELYLNRIYEHIDTLKKPFYIHIGTHHTHTPQYPCNSIKSSVEYLDDFVGKIIDKIDNNTILIFTSDNGSPYWFGEKNGDNSPYRCAKGSTWDGGWHVPAIIYNAKSANSSKLKSANSSKLKRKSKLFMTGLDWYGTILGMAEIPKMNYNDGYNLWGNILNGDDYYSRKPFFFHSVKTFGNISSIGAVMAMKFGSFKYHRYTSGGVCRNNDMDQKCNFDCVLSNTKKLFNLKNDLGEKFNLANNVRYVNMIRLLDSMMDDHKSFCRYTIGNKKGTNSTGFPCANPECRPYPQCCCKN